MCQYKLLRFGGDNLPGTRITHVSLAVGQIAILRIRVRHCVFRLVYLATYRKGSLFLWFLACHGVWPTTSWFRVLIASAVCCVFVRPPTRYLSWCSWYWRLGYKGPVSEEKRFGSTYVLFCKCFADWNLLLDSTGASARFILRQGVLINTRVRCGLCAGGGSLSVDAYFVMVVMIGALSASDILGSFASIFPMWLCEEGRWNYELSLVKVWLITHWCGVIQ